MKIEIKYIDDIAVIEIDGKININSSKIIETVGCLLDENHCNIVIDMDLVDFVDYNGLSVIAIAYKSVLNHKGMLKLCNISDHIIELLKVVKLDEVFEIYDSLEAAVNSFKEPAAGEEALAQPLRRKFQRLDIDIPVTYRLSKRASSGSEESYTGRLANISGAGIFVRTIHILPTGAEVELEIALKGTSEIFKLKGIVIWIPDKDIQPDLYPGIGIAFVKLSMSLQEDIISFIEKNVTHRNE